MKDFAVRERAHITVCQRKDGKRVAAHRRELDFVGLASAMDKHDCTDIPRTQPMLGKVMIENRQVEFAHGGDQASFLISSIRAGMTFL